MHQKQSIYESRRLAMREAERGGKPPLPMLPSVLMFANWSFVTQIGAGEVQRRNGRPATTHGFISGGPPALMCATSSAHAALIQEVTSAGWEGLQNTTGLWERGASRSQQERSKNRTLERSSGQNSYSCKDHTTSHMYSSCRENRQLSE